MRIALIAASRDIVGGQSVQAQALLNGLRGEGYPVKFIAINPAFPWGLRWVRRYRYFRTLLNQCLYLPSLLRIYNVDVVHVFSASYWSFIIAPLPAMLMARLLGKRVVLHYHSGEADDHLAHWGLLVHPWLRLANEIVVPSNYLRAVFDRYGYRSHVICNIIDLTRFHFRLRYPLHVRLLSVRNFESHYRVNIVLQAFALVRQTFPQATLTVAGSGPDAGQLYQLAENMGMQGIRFVGAIAAEAMPALYEQCDILINASVVDNQPVSVLESFAAGLPVISTVSGELGAMVRNGETGLTVCNDDPQAIAHAVAQLLENAQRSRLMAKQARAEVEQFTWSQARMHWIEIYKLVLAHHR